MLARTILICCILCVLGSRVVQADVNWDGKLSNIAATGGVITIGVDDNITITNTATPTVEIQQIVVNGILRCDASVANTGFHLRVHSIIVQGIKGVFECVAHSPIAERNSYIIELLGNTSFVPGENHLAPSEEFKAIVVKNQGTLRLLGHPGKATTSPKTRLSRTALAGEREICLRNLSSAEDATYNVKNHWAIGDEIVIATSSFHLQSNWFPVPFSQLQGKYNTYLEQNERRHITNITEDASNGETCIHFDKPLRQKHFGGRPSVYRNPHTTKLFVLDEAAHVVNLARNIKIAGTDPRSKLSDMQALMQHDGLGGHVIIRPSAFGYVDAVEFFHLGQMGRMARYPFHWHHAGSVPGQYIRHASLHDNFQRCVTIHGTNDALAERNTCFNTYGHGYFLEDGNEVRNTLVDNIAIQVRKMPSDRALLQSDFLDQDPNRFPTPAAYWISNPDNNVTRNVAIASDGTGLWNSFAPGLCCSGFSCRNHQTGAILGYGQLPGCPLVYNTSTYPLRSASPQYTDTRAFNDNEASSCRVGINWDGSAKGASTGNINNHNDQALELTLYSPPHTPIFSGLVMYKNSHRPHYFRGQLSFNDNFVMADNNNAPLFGNEAIMSNCLSVGWSRNAEAAFFNDNFHFLKSSGIQAVQPVGFRLYDGPAVLRNFVFSGYPSKLAFWTNQTGFGQFDVTPRGLDHEVADNRFNNLLESVKFTRPSNPFTRVHYHTPLNHFSYQASSFYDKTGDMTGVRDAAVVPDVPFLYVPSCTRSKHVRAALICRGVKTSALYFTGTKPHGPNTQAVFTVGRAPLYATITESHPFVSQSRMFGFVQSHPGSEQYAYHITHWNLQSNPIDPASGRDNNADIFWSNKVTYQSDRMGDVSPPFYFWAGGCDADKQLTFENARYGTSRQLQVLTNIVELLSGNGTTHGGVFYGAGFVVVRFKTDSARFCTDPSAEDCNPFTRRGDIKTSDMNINLEPYNESMRPEDMPLQAETNNLICCGPCNIPRTALPGPYHCTFNERNTFVAFKGFTSRSTASFWPPLPSPPFPVFPNHTFFLFGKLHPRCFTWGGARVEEAAGPAAGEWHSNVSSRISLTYPRTGQTIALPTTTHDASNLAPGEFMFSMDGAIIDALGIDAMEDLQVTVKMWNDAGDAGVFNLVVLPTEDTTYVPLPPSPDGFGTFISSWEFDASRPGSPATKYSADENDVEILNSDDDIQTKFPEIAPDWDLSPCELDLFTNGHDAIESLGSNCNPAAPRTADSCVLEELRTGADTVSFVELLCSPPGRSLVGWTITVKEASTGGQNKESSEWLLGLPAARDRVGSGSMVPLSETTAAAFDLGGALVPASGRVLISAEGGELTTSQLMLTSLKLNATTSVSLESPQGTIAGLVSLVNVLIPSGQSLSRQADGTYTATQPTPGAVNSPPTNGAASETASSGFGVAFLVVAVLIGAVVIVVVVRRKSRLPRKQPNQQGPPSVFDRRGANKSFRLKHDADQPGYACAVQGCPEFVDKEYEDLDVCTAHGKRVTDEVRCAFRGCHNPLITSRVGSPSALSLIYCDLHCHQAAPSAAAAAALVGSSSAGGEIVMDTELDQEQEQEQQQQQEQNKNNCSDTDVASSSNTGLSAVQVEEVSRTDEESK